MIRRLSRNVSGVPEGMTPWKLFGTYRVSPDAAAAAVVRGYVLAPSLDLWYEVRDQANKRGPSTIIWSDATRITPSEYEGSLVPGETRVVTPDLRLTADEPPRDEEAPYRHSEFHASVAQRTGRLIGIVVNPKAHKPALAIFHSEEYVSIYRMDEEGWPEEGRGYYHGECEPDSGDYGWTCAETGCVRVHTSSGVKHRDAGYGTALYMGLLLGAHQHDQTNVDSDYSGCISSGDIEGRGRSGAAQRWWRKQVDYGLAKSGSKDGDEEDYEEENVDATSALGDNLIGESIDEGEVTYVNRISVDVRGTRPGEGGEYQSISYQSALKAGLIIAALDRDSEGRLKASPDMYWRAVMGGDYGEPEVYVDSIIALDVRGLTLDAINMLGVLAGIGGATGQQLDHLRMRWELNLDPNEAVQQLYLLPNSARGDAAEAVAEAHEARQRLGWDRWEDDEDG